MKLVLAIVNNDDSAVVASALTKVGFFVTKLSTTGGFLQVGNTTFLIGTEDNKVEELKELLGKYCATRTKNSLSDDAIGQDISHMGLPKEVKVGGATYFVLDIADYGKI